MSSIFPLVVPTMSRRCWSVVCLTKYSPLFPCQQPISSITQLWGRRFKHSTFIMNFLLPETLIIWMGNSSMSGEHYLFYISNYFWTFHLDYLSYNGQVHWGRGGKCQSSYCQSFVEFNRLTVYLVYYYGFWLEIKKNLSQSQL